MSLFNSVLLSQTLATCFGFTPFLNKHLKPNQILAGTKGKLKLMTIETNNFATPVYITHTVRGQALAEAAELTNNDRNAEYGCPANNMRVVASMLTSLGFRGPDGREITGTDVSMFHVISKVYRATRKPTGHRDSFIDMAAYAGIAVEVKEGSLAVEPPATDNISNGGHYKPYKGI